MYSEWKKSDTLLKAPVIWTLTLDVFTKLLLSAKVCLMMNPTFLGVLHEQVMFCSPHLLPGLKSPFLSLFPDHLFQFLSYSLNFLSFFSFLFKRIISLCVYLWLGHCETITVSKQVLRFTFQPPLFLWQKDSDKFQSFPKSICAVNDAPKGGPSASAQRLFAELKLICWITVKHGVF